MNVFFIISLVVVLYSCVAIRSCAADDGAGDPQVTPDDGDDGGSGDGENPQVTNRCTCNNLIPDNIKCNLVSKQSTLGMAEYFSGCITRQ